MATEVIHVEGMTCGHCKASVEKALTSLQGVEKAEVSLDHNNVTVSYDNDKVTPARMKEEIEDIGYDVEK
ncbi:copper chaperone CopZ [Thalassorhabdus alkalitolerans]|uniref:Copper chaperone CopZ n=1 Tax=Thalassorhabdus alkalitolerans TaxID=2282697 RepID=A0ABW0YI23_9BACI|nr:copper chaperone CopZ [Thalassobacillus sp. C254]